MTLSFNEQKALLQLSYNGFISDVALKSKRAVSLLTRLKEKGLITFDQDDGYAQLTEAGEAAITRKGK